MIVIKNELLNIEKLLNHLNFLGDPALNKWGNRVYIATNNSIYRINSYYRINNSISFCNMLESFNPLNKDSLDPKNNSLWPLKGDGFLRHITNEKILSIIVSLIENENVENYIKSVQNRCGSNILAKSYLANEDLFSETPEYKKFYNEVVNDFSDKYHVFNSYLF